jgi:hypothetical protein
LTPDELTGLLERFPLERAAGRRTDDATEAYVQILLGRIAALTGALRGAEPDDTARLAARMLLGDLSAVASHFRGRTNTLRPALAEALAAVRGIQDAS